MTLLLGDSWKGGYCEQQGRCIDRYEQRFQRLGCRPEALFWSSEKTQMQRYMVIYQQLQTWKGCSILDVGCGFADFYDFLLRKGLDPMQIMYVGIDASAMMCQTALNAYPGVRVLHEDLLFYEGPMVDVVVMVGAMNYVFEDHESYLKRMLLRMWQLSKQWMLLSLLSASSSNKERIFYYYTQEELRSYVDELGLEGELRFVTGYLDNDVLMVIEKSG
ncbi:MAG: class I SAM-dependent methyltransferase [bacterium]